MKKYICALLLLIPMVVSAQKLADAFINEALKNGMNEHYFYHVYNKKYKHISAAEVSDRTEERGFFVMGYQTQLVYRYGAALAIFGNIDFIDEEHYPYYAFWVMMGHNGYPELSKETGSFFSYEKKSFKVDSISTLLGWIGVVEDIPILKKVNNVRWSGNIKDGFIDGSGFGFIEYGLGNYMAFTGTFVRGIPDSEISMRIFSKNVREKLSAIIKKEDIGNSKIQPMTNYICSYNIDTSDPQAKESLRQWLILHYDNNAKTVESVYQSVKSINSSNFEQFKSEGDVKLFIINYEEIGYDPQNMLPKVKEVKDVYGILPALRYKIPNRFWHYDWGDIKSYKMVWFKKDVEKGLNTLSNGIKYAEERKNKSRYGFNTFYADSHAFLTQNLKDFEKKVDEARDEFTKVYNKLLEKEKSEIATVKGGLDGSKCKSPSGKLREDLVSINIYCFTKDGELWTKSGHCCHYNIYYSRDNHEGEWHFMYARITLCDNGIELKLRELRDRHFQSEDELIEAVAKVAE